jgi:NAD(P)-dependent dehydrogenase (short-subunit alcohol dehydrogenase family)
MMSDAQHVGYSHPQSLRDRVIVVTGAAQGIGKGITEALLQRGASVLMVDQRADKLESAGSELTEAGYAPRQLVTDLRHSASAELVISAGVEMFGKIDGLVNNAIASNEPKAFVDITDEDYDLVYDVGPRATFRLMQAVHPALVAVGGGVIVNLGSSSGTAGQPQFGAYASAKEAIRGMSKVAALEWGTDNIRVNVVCPLANSDGMRVFSERAPKEYERVVRGVPLRRIGDTREDIGAVVAFLFCDDASYLTGQTLLLDGGSGSFR